MKKIISIACFAAFIGVACESRTDTTIETDETIISPAPSDTMMLDTNTMVSDTTLFRNDTLQ